MQVYVYVPACVCVCVCVCVTPCCHTKFTSAVHLLCAHLPCIHPSTGHTHKYTLLFLHSGFGNIIPSRNHACRRLINVGWREPTNTEIRRSSVGKAWGQRDGWMETPGMRPGWGQGNLDRRLDPAGGQRLLGQCVRTVVCMFFRLMYFICRSHTVLGKLLENGITCTRAARANWFVVEDWLSDLHECDF